MCRRASGRRPPASGGYAGCLRSLSSTGVERLGNVAAPVRAALTPRELEIATLAASGLADKQIAEKLFLSHRTVENKLHIVYEKVGVKSRNELAEVLRGYE